MNSLCSVLGVDFKQIVTEVHPSLGDSEESKNISNDTIEQLAAAIRKLRDVKLQRMQRVNNSSNHFSVYDYIYIFSFSLIDHCNPICFGSSKILQLPCWSSGI